MNCICRFTLKSTPREISSPRGCVTPTPLETLGRLVEVLEGPAYGAAKVGDVISPAKDHLVLQSSNGSVQPADGDILPRPWLNHGTMFFDFFDVASGEKLFKLSKKYRLTHPDSIFHRSRWVTNRFFFISGPTSRTFSRRLSIVDSFGNWRSLPFCRMANAFLA
jgi:hypothetical protein